MRKIFDVIQLFQWKNKVALEKSTKLTANYFEIVTAKYTLPIMSRRLFLQRGTASVVLMTSIFKEHHHEKDIVVADGWFLRKEDLIRQSNDL